MKKFIKEVIEDHEDEIKTALFFVGVMIVLGICYSIMAGVMYVINHFNVTV